VPIVTKQIREGPRFAYRILAVAERNPEGRLICPTIDFFHEAEAQEPEDLLKLSERLGHLGMLGVIRDANKFKPLTDEDNLQELRTRHGLRLITFRTETKEIICTNGVIKKKDDLSKEDIDRAKWWRRLYFEARKSGELYHEPEHAK
jgi:hypothetical protein